MKNCFNMIWYFTWKNCDSNNEQREKWKISTHSGSIYEWYNYKSTVPFHLLSFCLKICLVACNRAMPMMTFRYSFDFLSNFYEAKVVIGGICYQSAEGASRLLRQRHDSRQFPVDTLAFLYWFRIINRRRGHDFLDDASAQPRRQCRMQGFPNFATLSWAMSIPLILYDQLIVLESKTKSLRILCTSHQSNVINI